MLKKKILTILTTFLFVFVFTLASCDNGTTGGGVGGGLPAQVSQPPTNSGAAGPVGVYTSGSGLGSSLVIKADTQVYDAPYYGTVSSAGPYNGTSQTIYFDVNGNVIGYASLPMNGVLGTITVDAPPDGVLKTPHDFFEYMFGFILPAGAVKEGAGVLIGFLELNDLYLFASNAAFQDYDWVSGEGYFYVYSKGNGTMQLPRTQASPGFFMEVNCQFKAGWNCIAVSEYGDTTKVVSKNPPSNARWLWW